MSGLKIGELFAGYGGLGMGVQAAIGGDIAWVSEYDKGPSKILAHRFPGVPNHGDITKIDWSQVEPVDVLTGGSPCQDLSHAGARKGMTEGTRSNLWVAMREAIAQLRPGLVVWENVEGAASAAADSEVEPCAGCVGDGPGVHLRALGRVVGDLSSLGYVGRVGTVRAADVGAPHGRRRRFVAAFPADTHDGRRWQHHSGLGRVSVAHADGDQPDVVLLPTPMAAEGHKAVAGQSVAHREDGGHHVWLTNHAHDYAETGTWGQYAGAIQRWESLTRPAPAPTELGPKGNPRLSAAFSEWMMGLPAGWVTDVPGITRNEALKALGNGVVPQQAAAALRYLLGASEVAA